MSEVFGYLVLAVAMLGLMWLIVGAIVEDSK